MKKVAILQSNYIPWKGYFDLIAAVDEFIIYDDVQYTSRDWRNRNRIKTPNGLQWLSVPVRVKGKQHQSIREAEISGKDWSRTHWNTLYRNYRRASHFHESAQELEYLYQSQYTHLSQLNRTFIEWICSRLFIETRISNSWDYDLTIGRTERLLSLCMQAAATEYISGPAAHDYIDERQFRSHDIKLTWFNYDSYPEYPQLWGDFAHEVTILDLLLNCGKEACRYMKYVCS
ncbi:MAG: hypothetical protein C4576_20265 [Desulfobacteraceae bacterium]|nr:MAG: hypothetical protein C4576_20265 [Desulfobacteraceae bacterium]